jgi:hypothetical protein
MAGRDLKSPGHTHKFTIADDDAVHVLVEKLSAPAGSRDLDEVRLNEALAKAAHQYARSPEKVRQAFFHGLLTGYGVGLKHK